MHPLTCDLTQSVTVDTRKTTYLVNMESIKSPSSSTKQVVSTTINNPTQIQSLSSSKSSENFVSTTTRTDTHCDTSPVISCECVLSDLQLSLSAQSYISHLVTSVLSLNPMVSCLTPHSTLQSQHTVLRSSQNLAG